MSGELLSMKSDVARFDPEKEFGTPDRLKESIGLTRGQKIAALERWGQQIRDRLAAVSEGMATVDPSATDTALLDHVNDTIAELSSPADPH